MLILGVGAGCTIGAFHLAYATLHRSLTYEQPSRIAVAESPLSDLLFSGYTYTPNPLLNSVFVRGAGYWYQSGNLMLGSHPRHIAFAMITPDFFATLGVRLQLGRMWSSHFPTPQPGHAVGWFPIVISDLLWRRDFAARRDIVGREIRLEGGTGAFATERYLVVGVAPPGVSFPPGADAWVPVHLYSVPLIQEPEASPLYQGAIGRLRPGLSLLAAESIIAAWPTRRATNWRYEDGPVVLRSLRDVLAGDVPRLGRLLWLSSLFLLALAVIAAEGVLAADLRRREQELANKSRLGATAGRLRLSLALEIGIFLLLAAGVAYAARDLSSTVSARYLRLSLPGEAGWREVAMMAVPALIVLAAALRRQRGILKAAERIMPPTRLALQWGVTAIVLIAAVLLACQAYALLHADLGVMPRNVFVAEIEQPPPWTLPGYQSPASATPMEQQARILANDDSLSAQLDASVVRRLEASPGIRGAGMISVAPYNGLRLVAWWQVKIAPGPAPCHWPNSSDARFAAARSLSSGGPAALGMTVLYGHDFPSSDDVFHADEALVNQTLARVIVGGSGVGALGKYFCNYPGPSVRIIGVLRDVHETSILDPPVPTIYFPLAYGTGPNLNLVARAEAGTPPGVVLGLMRSVTKAVNPNATISHFAALSAMIGAAEADGFYAAMYLLGLAAIALLLAAVAAAMQGADEALRRRHEIGIRIALGATPADITRLIAARAIKSGVAAALAGGLCAIWFVRIFDLIFRTRIFNPGIYAAVLPVLVAFVVATEIFSARRAWSRTPRELL